MRRQLLTLSIALPLSLHALAYEHDEHASLGAHEHGVASLNLAIEGAQVQLELDSPAMNLLGFEHAAHSPDDIAKVKAVQAQLQQADQLFRFPAAADCTLASADLDSPLFATQHDAEHEHEDHDHDGAHDHDEEPAHHHADIEASYTFNCAEPDQLTHLELPLFAVYPGLERINLQGITPKGQMGAELTAERATVQFD
ncbi:Protein of unknown function [Halopseudomonas sabulinigri]|uniref:DUF2796 domain-containing protein n=1 Tax=Halopseudomonas sabulinigri TaxID=472181 RepID=A0A1H1VC16_9GAMM|nr:DUF2796 domain-containing protein [Halopseudomonas sabulinigri]SDS81946.1 Protein of unknown function [Halopseudomonas sabulinigri]